MKLVNSCVLVQALNHDLLLWKSGFDPRAVHVGCVLDLVAQGMFSSDYVNFLPLITILIMNHISSSVMLDMSNRTNRGCSLKSFTLIPP